jgi:hypothetical protein
MSLFDPLALDPHKPSVLKPSLAQWDNYQIYTLVCRDITQTVTTKKFVADQSIDAIITPAGQYASDVAYFYEGEYGISNHGEFLGRDNNPLTGIYSDVSDKNTTAKLSDFLAIQTFNPCQPKINFFDYVDRYSGSNDSAPKSYLTYGNLETIQLDVPQNFGTYTNQPPPNTGVTENPRFRELFDLAHVSSFSYLGNPISSLNGRIIAKISERSPRSFYYAFLDVWFWNISGYGRFWNFYKQIIHAQIPKKEPNYIDLLNGYDHLLKPKNPKIVPKFSSKLSIGYYRPNRSEPILGLSSIDWFEYQIEVIKDRPIILPIDDVVLGTLWISNLTIANQIKALPNILGSYDWGDLFPENIDVLFVRWRSQYHQPLPTYSGDILIETTYSPPIVTVRRLGANNNIWKNGSIVEDIEVDSEHPMFLVDELRTFNYHFKPQSDGSFGDLVMDSPRIIELWNHFCSETPFQNDIDQDKPRLDTHGKRLKRTSEILGYRLNANGEIDKKTEEEYTRHIVPPKSRIDKTKYGGNSFGSHGMHVRRLPNHFDRNQIKEGGVVAIHDIGQLLLEILDQLNLAIGIQEAGAIELKHEGKIHKYQNLLALTTDIAIHQFNQTQYAKSTHISSLVTQEQTKEIIGGMGLPTVAKSIRREVNGKVAGIPYWGIAPQASLARKIDTCTYNVGIILGQVL